MARLRDLGVTIGQYPTGLHNAITDVPGVLVGHSTLVYDEPRVARTGVTVIVPREGNVWRDNCFAGFHSFNGCGEMTGIHWVKESGLLCSPIALTCTHQVGLVHEALVQYGAQHERARSYIGALPVVAETWDGWLNDANAHHITHEHVFAAMDSAKGGPVEEGCVGGGTGMICYEFKGGIGTSSRIARTEDGEFVVGVLVQSNHGVREGLRVNGIPVGAMIGKDRVPIDWDEPADQANAGSSVIIVIGTDAPLIPTQCDRLAQRATVGLARTGGVGYNGSGDLFLCFSTGNHISEYDTRAREVRMLAHRQLNALFEATAEAVEEAIVNSMVAAETMTGFRGRTVYALPHDALVEVMAKLAR
ncbi:MAG: P1 family peptidase [Anaerolineae bacterium]|nr:P1 family peptidase [Candidatus Roseilinea sp.]MDW8448688.1 P1 family peptidase [Anaerolineae bacterium]